jgi:hypothetical protein
MFKSNMQSNMPLIPKVCVATFARYTNLSKIKIHLYLNKIVTFVLKWREAVHMSCKLEW